MRGELSGERSDRKPHVSQRTANVGTRPEFRAVPAQAILKNPPEVDLSMAKLVYGLSQSLDGYVDHMKLGPPPPAAFRHFLELVRGMTGLIYGRRMYEIMCYWDEDSPDWDADDREFAMVYRSRPKWVVSHSLKSVGPNATLIGDDFETAIRRLKAERAGEIHVGGPSLARSLTEAGLIDEYRLYFRPIVLGGGTPFFSGPRPPLHLVASDLIVDDWIRLTYVPG